MRYGAKRRRKRRLDVALPHIERTWVLMDDSKSRSFTQRTTIIEEHELYFTTNWSQIVDMIIQWAMFPWDGGPGPPIT